jgi:hypothetical protein
MINIDFLIVVSVWEHLQMGSKGPPLELGR